ncbi:hypothetical protein CMQ_4098 [Grosmannia clavigera kw1407]|uniref:Uncharacterized protein n=1 Tax=Grosmannia clavigera (strain kw1407 / UAMH 11150) TaxID=655863 RepID=F0X923_GROCL|nr:uncharacterized protein CMQ_4098 [Grosmannia clavigera kw1407]EFX06029.1 hypothetical protein CMQ_4098 [Grosmannia clavigera kw1407]
MTTAAIEAARNGADCKCMERYRAYFSDEDEEADQVTENSISLSYDYTERYELFARERLFDKESRDNFRLSSLADFVNTLSAKLDTQQRRAQILFSTNACLVARADESDSKFESIHSRLDRLETMLASVGSTASSGENE